MLGLELITVPEKYQKSLG